MKPHHISATLSSGLFLGLALPLSADTFNWNGSTTGGGTGTSNVWNTTTENWTGDDIVWPSVSSTNDDAVFGGTAGVVTLDTTVTANDITFSTPGYTIGVDNGTGIIILDGTNPTITGVTGSLSSISARIQGSSGLVKAGPATVQLRGANTYTGDTRVLRGNLLIGLSNNRLPTGTNLILGDPVTNTSGVFQMNSRSQQVGGLQTAGSGAGNRVINSSVNASTFTVSNAADQIFGGILGGTTANDNNYNFTKSGIGRLTLTSQNTFTGTANITGGILELGHATNTLADTIPVNVNGGTLDIADKTETIDALTVTSGSITGTTGVLTAKSCAGKAGTVSAILASVDNLSGTNTTWLTKDTAGTLVLSGANTFTGNITVTAGRLTLAHSQALGIADPNPMGTNRKGVICQGVSRSIWLRGGITIPANIDFLVSSNSFDGGGINNESGNNEIEGPISITTGNPALNIASDSGALVVSGNVTLVATGRTLYLGGASEDNNTISGNISENSAAVMPVVKQGDGKWILSGINTYKGDTTVNGGTLVLADGGSTRFQPKSDGSSNKITGNGSIIVMDGAFNIDLSGAVAAPDATEWLLVDVANLDATFDANFYVVGFTEDSPGTWVYEAVEGTYTFTESDGKMVKSVVSSSPFEDWISSLYPGLENPDNLPESDPDGDGASNLEEFAFSGDPTDGGNNGLSRFGIEDVSGTDYLTLTFACRAGAVFSGGGPAVASVDGVDYTVRASLDLSSFTTPIVEVVPAITTGLPETAPSGYSYRTFRISAASSLSSRAFMQALAAASAP
ncbi:MAG: hypothetical protein RLZ97_1681 [Verrucomicrobiota bacterium]